MSRLLPIVTFVVALGCAASMDLGGKKTIPASSVAIGGDCSQDADCVSGLCVNRACVAQPEDAGFDAGPRSWGTCPGPASATAPTFGSVILFSTNSPEGTNVGVGDVNGDGIPDILQSNYFTGSNYDAGSFFGVYFGLPAGGFSDPQHFAEHPSDYAFAAIYDPDGGGAIAAMNSQNQVDIFSSDGRRLGGFPRPGFSLGYGGITFASADLDLNGAPDFAVCSQDGVQAFLEQGGYAFDDGQIISQLPCEAIAAGEVDGDTIPDLVFSGPGTQSGEHPTSDAVTVLVGQPDGGYLVSSYSTGSTGLGLSLALTDLNGDGLPDIAVAGDPGFFVLLNLGGGQFSNPVSYSSGASSADSLTVADFNGDCWPDIVVTDGTGCGSPRTPFTLHLFLNNGDGTFSAETSIDPGVANPLGIASYQVAGARVASLAIADVCTGQLGFLPNVTMP